MPLDILVMPLARYLAGDFEPPPLPAGEERFERPREPATAEEARGRIYAIWHHMSDALGVEIAWRDEGEVAFAACADPRGLHGLRALAAHHEYPPGFGPLRRKFRLPADPREHRSLRRIYDGEDTRFVHLMRHSDNRGFWFPVNFEHPMGCGESAWWMVGSAPGLARELAEIEPWIPSVPREPDRARLAAALEVWQAAAQASETAGLPIIIEG